MTLTGSCHCGKTRFTIAFTPTTATRCTCTFCSKRGALWAYGPPEQFTLLTPREDLATYARDPNNKHHFCGTCGCGTFTEAPDYAIEPFDPDIVKVSINLHVLDDFDVHALPVEVIDGRNLW